MEIFVFDFDLTLTTTHSSGWNFDQELFTEQQFENIIKMFRMIKEKNQDNLIFICSRGLKKSIMEYLKNYSNNKYEKLL